MTRKVLAVTGSRAEYGAMRPVFRAVAASARLRLELIVTGMHLAPEFKASLDEIVADNFCPRHLVDTGLADGTGLTMAHIFGTGVTAMANQIASTKPDLVLLQGDRGEMLAAAVAAAHLNIPIVHMSGGDQTGSIDDAIRNSISAFSHVHLTTCAPSSTRLITMGEDRARVFDVGEPVLDAIAGMTFEAPEALAAWLKLDLSKPIVLATQHPVTTEADQSVAQLRETLHALAGLGHQTVFTYPNTDAGGQAMIAELNAWRDRPFLRIVPHLGSLAYLSLMRITAVMVGNSSSGLLEAPSFRLPAVNIGTRQNRRVRATNVIDAPPERTAITSAIQRTLNDVAFRSALATCVNPYGNGTCAVQTVRILENLRIDERLIAKWLTPPTGGFLAP